MKKQICQGILWFLKSRPGFSEDEGLPTIGTFFFLLVLAVVLAVPGYVCEIPFEKTGTGPISFESMAFFPSCCLVFIFLVAIAGHIFRAIALALIFCIIVPLIKLFEFLSGLYQRFVISPLERGCQ